MKQSRSSFLYSNKVGYRHKSRIVVPDWLLWTDIRMDRKAIYRVFDSQQQIENMLNNYKFLVSWDPLKQ